VEELERAQEALKGRNSELEASLAPLRARVGELEAANRLVEDRARELRFEVEARDETARKAADSMAELKVKPMNEECHLPDPHCAVHHPFLFLLHLCCTLKSPFPPNSR